MIPRNRVAVIVSTALALVFSAVGCGSSSQGGLSPLTAAQRAEVADTLASATRPVYAAQAVAPQAPGAMMPQAPRAMMPQAPRAMMPQAPRAMMPQNTGALASLLFPTTGPSLSTGDNNTSARAAMSQRLSNPSQCQVVPVGSMPSGNIDLTQPFNIQDGITVSGSGCPASLQVSLQATNQGGTSSLNLNASIKASYQANAQDADYEQLNDIDSFQLDGSLTLNASQSGAMGSGQLSAKLHSQKYGNISIDGSGSVTGNSGGFQSQSSITLTYPNFTAVIGISSSSANGSQPTTQYTLNGEPVTQDQLQRLLTAGQQ